MTTSAFPLISLARTTAMIAVLATATVVSARAADAPTAPMKSSSSAKSTAAHEESVEERIANLKTQLKITADEEAKWDGVAAAMRENATAMEKLVADKSNQAPDSMTALDNLKTYAKFAQAHVDGLKNLTAAFESLYNAMPADQQKIADQVFRSYNGKSRATHS